MLVQYAFQQIQLNPLLQQKTAGEKRIIPIDNEQYRYLRFRAIANMEVNGFNGNFDGFGYEDFEDDEPGYGYKSFIGKRAHHEHNSALKERGSIGDLPDAYLNRLIYPDDSPKKWSSLAGYKLASKRQSILDMPGQKDGAIEVLMRIDTTLRKKSVLEPETKKGLERIVRMIDSGQKLFCSMGVNVESSLCSACGNSARFASDYCDHLKKGRKGGITIVAANQLRDMLTKDILRNEWLKHIVISSRDIDEILKGISNKGIAVKNGEINKKLSFFELSVVHTPAYEQADALEKIANLHIEDRRDYLNMIRKTVGDDNLIDVYALLQEEGKIASSCTVGMFK